MKRSMYKNKCRGLDITIRLFLGLSLLFIPSVFAEKNLTGEQTQMNDRIIVFTTIFTPTMQFFSQMSEVYTEAFGRMGYRFKLISQPGERAMIDANLGIADGEAGRIIEIEMEQYQNLIRVPEAIVTMQDGAYAVDDSIKVSGWESLRNAPYTVGLMKGIKSVEQKLPLYVESSHIVRFDKVEQGLEMLKAKRIDLFIVTTLIEDMEVMKSDDFSEITCVGIVETKSLYPWMHKRNKDLIMPLAETLKRLKAEEVNDPW